MFFTVNVTEHLIFGNNFIWVLNFDLIFETLYIAVASGLLNLTLGKTQLFSFYPSNSSNAINLIIYGCVFKKNQPESWLKCVSIPTRIAFLT